MLLPTLPKLLAFDLDQTLLAEGGIALPPSSARAIRRYQDLGVQVAVITGRDEVPVSVLALGLSAHALHNGALILRGQQLLQSRYLDQQTIEALLASKPADGHVMVLTHDCVYALWSGVAPVADELAWRERWALAHRPFVPLEQIPPDVMGLWCFADDVVPWKKSVLARFPHLSITGAQPPYSDNMNISAEGVEKGAALQHIAELLHIELADVWAFGDSDNDLPMLRLAGRPVGMGSLPLLDAVTSERVADFSVLGEWLEQQLLGVKSP